jgi:hypothetical protein
MGLLLKSEDVTVELPGFGNGGFPTHTLHPRSDLSVSRQANCRCLPPKALCLQNLAGWHCSCNAPIWKFA